MDKPKLAGSLGLSRSQTKSLGMASFTTSILIRHGPTRLNREGKYISFSDPPLSEDGQSQAKEKAYQIFSKLNRSNLTDVSLFTSPSVRARQTTKHFEKQFSRDAEVCDGLRETNLGVLEGFSKSDLSLPSHPHHKQFLAWRDEASMKAPTQGESFEEIESRCALVAQLISRQKKPSILITHGIFARCLTSYLCMGGDVTLYRSIFLDVLGHIQISNSEGNFRIVELSQVLDSNL